MKNATTALALLITGCAQQTFTVQPNRQQENSKETITHHFFVSGSNWAEENCRWKCKFVAAQKMVRKKQEPSNIPNGLLGFITLGIYTPLEARVYCSIIIT